VDLRGDVLRNGTRLQAQDRIAAGDQLETGPGSRVVLTVGDSAFLVRENTRLALEGDSPVTVRLLRLLSGAVASVWSRGTDRQIVTPTMTAGIRGHGRVRGGTARAGLSQLFLQLLRHRGHCGGPRPPGE